MCGIVGVYNYKSEKPVEEKLLVKMRDVMVHRGPDSAGIYINRDKKIGLANRRLSIIDLANVANQPMSNEDGSVWIVFNGEIYNHQELRTKLGKLGHRFRTDHSDTEVVIHAYEEWRENCVHKFRGMFAFGLWDDNKKELWLGRDRMGIKPLYYAVNGGQFMFASELKALLLNLNKKEISPEGLVSYLVFRASVAPNTLIKGINKVESGEIIKVSHENNSIEKFNFYNIRDFPTNTTGASIKYEKALERLDQLLRESIKYRLISDVPLCLFLSGGVDSSLIAAIASSISKNKIKAFAVGLVDSNLDESSYAEYAAKKLNLDLTIKKIDSSALENLDEWLCFNDDLVSDPSALALFILSKEVKREGYKVVLTGEGSDELFGGYDEYCKGYTKVLSLIKKNFLPSSLACLSSWLYSIYPMQKIEKIHKILSKDTLFYGTAEINSPLSLNKLIKEKVLATEFYKKIKILFAEKGGVKNRENLLRLAMLVDIMFRLPNDELLRTDRATMANSIEARVPFMDYRLVEFASSLPLEYKISSPLNIGKKIVKDLAAKYFDKDFVYREKMGFPMPVNDWMREKNIYNEFSRYLQEKRIQYLNYDFIDKIYNLHLNKVSDFSARLFNIYILEKYIRKWEIQ